MTERRLRIAHVIVQPVLVWDDGEELSPGPAVQPMQVPLNDLPLVPDRLRADLPRAEQESAEPAP